MAFIVGMFGGAYWALQSSKVQTYLTQRLAGHLSEKTGAKISVGKVDIAYFRRVILKDILVEDQKADTLLFVQSVSAHIDSLKIRKQKLVLDQLTFEGTTLRTSRDSLHRFNFSFILDSFKSKQTQPNDWLFSCNNFNFLNASVVFQDLNQPEPQVLNINDFQFTVSDFFFQNDSTHMKINQLALNDGKEFRINDFNSIFSISGKKIYLEDFYLKTGFSEISQSNLFVELPDSSENFLEAIQFDFQFSHSQISFYDVALLVPSLRGMDQVVDCSGQIGGTINDLRGKDLELATGKNTYARMDFYVNEITNRETMYLFLDLKQSRTSFNEISRIKLPGNGKIKFLSFPEEL